MLSMYEMRKLYLFQESMFESDEKELLNKLLFEYDQYMNCGTVEECQFRKKGLIFMNKQGLNEKIRNRIGRNLYYMSCVVTNDNVRTEFEKNNEILNDIVVGMRQEKSSDDYEKGLNDAWELAQKIIGTEHPETWDCGEVMDIFNVVSSYEVFDQYSYQEALAKVKEYEKKKAEEEAKLVRGDYVTYKICDKTETAIFLDECDDHYWVLSENYACPQNLWKMCFQLTKTGKHVDLKGLFKEIDND